VICGTSHGKVRLMFDPAGRNVKEAYPGMAVTVTGWKTLPNVGDEVLQGSESDVKKAISNRLRKAEVQATLNDMDAINEHRATERERKKDQSGDGALTPGSHQEESGPKELRLVVKGDVTGSVEAVVEALQVIGNKDACVKIVASGVGDVTESDVLRAQASGGDVSFASF
jgi:translation initiation factor IF-2